MYPPSCIDLGRGKLYGVGSDPDDFWPDPVHPRHPLHHRTHPLRVYRQGAVLLTSASSLYQEKNHEFRSDPHFLRSNTDPNFSNCSDSSPPSSAQPYTTCTGITLRYCIPYINYLTRRRILFFVGSSFFFACRSHNKNILLLIKFLYKPPLLR